MFKYNDPSQEDFSHVDEQEETLSDSLNLKSYKGTLHLNMPAGEHDVGFIDYMTKGRPSEAIFVRLMYPTVWKSVEHSDKWPIWKEPDYLKGFYRFIRAMARRFPSWAPKDDFHHFDNLGNVIRWLPNAVEGAVPKIFYTKFGRVHVPISEGAPLDVSRKWPVVVFSHGLGCSRTTYSRIAFDLASKGYIVASTEHRDGSACHSFYVDENSEKVRIHHREHDQQEDEYEFRNGQLKHRVSEVRRTLDFLHALNAGKLCPNVLDDANNSSYDDVLKTFVDRVDLSAPALVGHSFGGATTAATLAEDERFAGGVALDAWMFPTRDMKDIGSKIERPLLFLSADTFRTADNIGKIKEFSQNTKSEGFFYVKGSIHQNVLDASFLVDWKSLRQILGLESPACREAVMRVNHCLTLHTIQKIQSEQTDEKFEEYVKQTKDKWIEELF